jgi:hypothetical protein
MKMNIPSIKSFGATALFVLAFTIFTATFASAQNLDQCANGKLPDPPVDCTGAAWQNGNLNENNSQYVEGDSVPFRVYDTGLTPGSTGSVTIEFDTTKSGKHAYDYLTTFDRSYPGDPCSDVPLCDPSVFDTAPIPIDPNAVNQLLGQEFILYGGTIDSVSGYTLDGSYAGDSTTSITITYTVGDSGTLVLAWAGHIATRIDWGLGNSAINIPGSPYHMRIGGQDRSLKVSSVTFPAIIRIVKDATPFPGHPTGTDFVFTSTFFGTPSSFFLDDDADPTLSNVEVRTTTDFVNPITVTEASQSGWSISNLTCVDADGGLGFTADSTPQAPGTLGPTATIRVQEAELVQCTFSNVESAPTAAGVSAEGRVVTSKGAGIAGISVKLTNANTGAVSTTTSDASGNFRFEDLEIGNFYVVTGATKGYTYNQVQFVPDDNVTGIKIVASTATKGGR